MNTITVKERDLQRKAAHRPAGYYRDVTKRAIRQDENGDWVLRVKEWDKLARKYRNRQRQSRGLGDTVAKVTAATGLDKIAKAYTKATGRDCGCSKRRQSMNEKYPYKQGRQS